MVTDHLDYRNKANSLYLLLFDKSESLKKNLSFFDSLSFPIHLFLCCVLQELYCSGCHVQRRYNTNMSKQSTVSPTVLLIPPLHDIKDISQDQQYHAVLACLVFLGSVTYHLVFICHHLCK